MAAIASIALTGVLAILTGYYAWQTRRTVEEMRRARGASVVPHVVLSFDHPGGAIGFLVISNVGVGPAVDVKVAMEYRPSGPTIPWQRSVVAPGERHRFLGPDRIAEMDKFIELYEVIAATGSCKDALGDEHRIDTSIELKSYWEANKAAMHLVDKEPLEKLSDDVEKIRRALESRTD